MFTAKAIIPSKELFNEPAFVKAITDALDTGALWVQSEFYETTQTWQRQVDFQITQDTEFTRDIWTSDEVYGWVNNGTAAHQIDPKTGLFLKFTVPFAPKSQKNVIGSYQGNRGDVIRYQRSVQHPGIEPREFDETIAREWNATHRLSKLVQENLNSVV